MGGGGCDHLPTKFATGRQVDSELSEGRLSIEFHQNIFELLKF